MANRDRAVKALVAAMSAVDNIQQNQNKLLMLRLENDTKFRNDFMLNMLKGRQDIENKKAMMPINIEEKRQKNLLPKTPTTTYKDTLFQEIRKKPQDQWEGWEKKFMDTYTGGGEQAIVDAEGNIVGYRPRKSVFRPKGSGNDMSFLGDEQPAGQTAVLPNGIDEESIQHTLKLHPEYTRESLLKKLGAE